MPDFSQGKIYKLTAGDLTYYGSTTQTLKIRLNGHCSKDCSSKILFESGNKVNIELVESYPCETKEQLLKRENYYIKNFNCVNQNASIKTKQEIIIYQKHYRENNKECMKEYKKQYYKNNKEYISDYNKQYREDNKEYISDYNKQYREDNKEVKAEYDKKYREANKEAINAKRSEKVECECGCIVTKRKLSIHCKSQKHLNNMQNFL